MNKGVISSFRIVLISITNYDVMIFTIVMHPHLKALGNQEGEKWNTVNYSVRLDNYVRWESKKKFGKCIVIELLSLVMSFLWRKL